MSNMLHASGTIREPVQAWRIHKAIVTQIQALSRYHGLLSGPDTSIMNKSVKQALLELSFPRETEAQED